jgi:hypothetical protein
MEDYKVSGVVQSGEQSQEDSRSQRGRRKPTWMEDYEVSGVVQSGEQSDDVFFFHYVFLSDCDPITFEEVAKESKWQKAMDEEIMSIEKKTIVGN